MLRATGCGLIDEEAIFNVAMRLLRRAPVCYVIPGLARSPLCSIRARAFSLRNGRPVRTLRYILSV